MCKIRAYARLGAARFAANCGQLPYDGCDWAGVCASGFLVYTLILLATFLVEDAKCGGSAFCV